MVWLAKAYFASPLIAPEGEYATWDAGTLDFLLQKVKSLQQAPSHQPTPLLGLQTKSMGEQPAQQGAWYPAPAPYLLTGPAAEQPTQPGASQPGPAPGLQMGSVAQRRDQQGIWQPAIAMLAALGHATMPETAGPNSPTQLSAAQQASPHGQLSKPQLDLALAACLAHTLPTQLSSAASLQTQVSRPPDTHMRQQRHGSSLPTQPPTGLDASPYDKQQQQQQQSALPAVQHPPHVQHERASHQQERPARQGHHTPLLQPSSIPPHWLLSAEPGNLYPLDCQPSPPAAEQAGAGRLMPSRNSMRASSLPRCDPTKVDMGTLLGHLKGAEAEASHSPHHPSKSLALKGKLQASRAGSMGASLVPAYDSSNEASSGPRVSARHQPGLLPASCPAAPERDCTADWSTVHGLATLEEAIHSRGLSMPRPPGSQQNDMPAAFELPLISQDALNPNLDPNLQASDADAAVEPALMGDAGLSLGPIEPAVTTAGAETSAEERELRSSGRTSLSLGRSAHQRSHAVLGSGSDGWAQGPFETSVSTGGLVRQIRPGHASSPALSNMRLAANGLRPGPALESRQGHDPYVQQASAAAGMGAPPHRHTSEPGPSEQQHEHGARDARAELRRVSSDAPDTFHMASGIGRLPLSMPSRGHSPSIHCEPSAAGAAGSAMLEKTAPPTNSSQLDAHRLNPRPVHKVLSSHAVHAGAATAVAPTSRRLADTHTPCTAKKLRAPPCDTASGKTASKRPTDRRLHVMTDSNAVAASGAPSAQPSISACGHPDAAVLHAAPPGPSGSKLPSSKLPVHPQHPQHQPDAGFISGLADPLPSWQVSFASLCEAAIDGDEDGFSQGRTHREVAEELSSLPAHIWSPQTNAGFSGTQYSCGQDALEPGTGADADVQGPGDAHFEVQSASWHVSAGSRDCGHKFACFHPAATGASGFFLLFVSLVKSGVWPMHAFSSAALHLNQDRRGAHVLHGQAVA